MKDTENNTQEATESPKDINTEMVNDQDTNQNTEPVKSKRGRKRKVEGLKTPLVCGSEDLPDWPENIKLLIQEKLSGADEAKSTLDKSICSLPNSDIRDRNGLIKNLEYKYDPYGFIDWRAMINPKHIVLNKNSVAKAGYVYEALSDSDREKFLNEWSDDKKVIRLAGFKEVARLRGYYSVDNQIKQEGDKVICHCTINWLRNFEGQFSYTAVASASPANVAPDYSQFLEAVACNRAFSRAVRESLNIHVVSDEELDPNKVEEVSNKSIPSTHPRAQLIKVCKEKGIEFSTVKVMIGSLNIDNEDIVSFETIPAPTAMAVLAEIRKG